MIMCNGKMIYRLESLYENKFLIEVMSIRIIRLKRRNETLYR